MNPETTAELNNYLSQFVHDCRNRIGSLKITLHLLEQKGDPAMKPFIRQLREQIADLNRLIEDLWHSPTN